MAGGKTPLALHVGQPSAEAGMQSAHTRDCIDTNKDTLNCCRLRNATKSQAHTPSQS